MKSKQSRFYPLVVVIFLLMLILIIRLFVVTILQHDQWSERADRQNTKDIVTPAARGNITDRYGNILATNEVEFSATFNASSLTGEELNQSALDLIRTFVKNGDKYIDKFPIKIAADGSFYYTFDEEKDSWLEKNGLPKGISGAEAFQSLRNKYGIDPNMDRRDVPDEIYKKYQVNIPIYAKNMQYTFDKEKEDFLEKFGFSEKEIKKKPSAEQVFKKLRKKYDIDKKLSDEEARYILIIRNETVTFGFTRYLPITIAKGISKETIAYIEETPNKGVAVTTENKRVYPRGKLASHILGYMGSISDSEVKKLTKKGYRASDLIGKDGVEGFFESKLKGQDGVKRIRVNSSGEYIKTLSESDPIPGKDVYLTIDANLQEQVESLLEAGIHKASIKYPRCQSGAAVVLDVKSGDVLAMASYPDYDPNIFSGGITNEAWESVQSKNPRDPLAPIPLYNIATRTAVQPGSTFKPATALAAISQGLSTSRVINNRGVIKLGNRNFGCYIWNMYGGSHGPLSLTGALGVSCNYYFYCIGTGKDWGSGSSLGYNITIDKIIEVAKELGLGEKTGIQIGESLLPAPTEEYHKEQIKNSLWSTIYESATDYFPEKTVKNYRKLHKDIDYICSMIDEKLDREEITERIKKNTNVIKDKAQDLADLALFSFFNQAEWGTGDQFNISIGQGDNAYTPVQVARYVATIGNKGYKNEVNIIKGISREGMTQRKAPEKLNSVDESVYDVILEGMRQAANHAGAGKNLGASVNVAGKTGTAERFGKINPADEISYIKDHLSQLLPGKTYEDVQKEIEEIRKDKRYKYSSENDLVDYAVKRLSGYTVSQTRIDTWKANYDNFAWMMAVAPAEEPEIAVVVLLVQGGESALAAPVAGNIIDAYMSLKSQMTSKTTGESATSIGENKIN